MARGLLLVSVDIGNGVGRTLSSSAAHQGHTSMTKSRVVLKVTCLSFGLLACEAEPELMEISSTQAALTATENTERALQGIIDAADFLAESTSIAEALNAIGDRGVSCDTVVYPCAADAASCPPPETTCTSEEIAAADIEEARTELRESAADLVQELRERIFIPQNLESETSTSATYRLGPDVLCGYAEPSVVGTAPTERDPECVEQVARYQPRLVLTSPSEGDIDVTLLLGAERRAPLSLELHAESLGLRLDLDEAFALAGDLGEELEGVRDLSGVLELRLVQNRARDYSLELNVFEALSAVIESDADTLTASLAPTAPAWDIRVDGNSRTLSAGLDLGAFQLLGPLSAFAGMFEGGDVAASGAGTAPGEEPSFDAAAPAEEPAPRVYTGVIDLFLAGLSGRASYTAESDVLRLDDLGFGDATTTLKHDDATLLALDLNAAHGRRVALEVRPEGDGAQLRIIPTLDLRLALAFDHVADQIEDIADELLNDTLRVWFDGEEPTVETNDDRLRVVSGTLHVSSAADPSVNVDVAAGMCLADETEAGDVETETAEHPWSGLQVIACD